MLDSEGLNRFEQKIAQGNTGEDKFVPAAITDPGCDRELNEDRYAVIESNSGLMWLVCDGMGGVKGGELAAQLVIDSIKRYLETNEAEAPSVVMKEAFNEANRIIVLRRQNAAFAEMGTTVVGTVFYDRQVVIANVGDSRAYLISDDSITQLTKDDTFVQELVNSGQISMKEAMHHPQAHVLTRAIGSEPYLDVNVHNFWIWDTDNPTNQDYLLMCSDGLYSLVSDEEIAEAVKKYPPQVSCTHLVELAKERGGYDNITVAVVPLIGKLKDTPPEGYSAPHPSTYATGSVLQMANLKSLIVKNVLMIVGLSVIAKVLALVLVLYSLSK